MATSTERFGFTLPSGQDPASVVPLNLNTQNIEKYLGMTQDMLAPLYDATEGTYEVDDIVTHDSVLYKCIEAVETPEDFDETKWVQTTAVSEGGGGAGAIEKTQSEYNALTPAQKENGAIYMVQGSQELDDNYSYYSAENDTIIVRVYHEGESDQKIEWFFRGWNQTSGDMTVPSDLTAYLPSTPQVVIYSANYPNATTPQNGWIGFYRDSIRAWTQDLANTTTGIMYGVVDIDGGAEQTNPYVDDPHIYVEGSNKIYYMGTEYANTNGGSGGSSSGSSYEETSLFSGQTASTGEGVTVNLNGNISDYDAIVIDCGRYGESAWRHGYVWYLTSDISIGQSFLQIINTNDNATAYWFYDADTSITWASAYNAYPVTLFSIKGIKFGSGGGGSSIDYSTEEKEVGTWIDGSVLYSKTFTFTNREISNTSETNIGNVTGSTPIKQFINAFLTSSIYGTYSSCACYLDNGDLVVTTDIRAQYDTITIQYTKVVS